MEEIGDKQTLIAQLQEIITNPLRLIEVVQEELDEMKSKFGDERRTQVSDDVGDMA
ncbi:hypothetical protein KBB05_00680 [Patescibacteria group bacterium]|nr:hypothetical protein [Patescibacteria group bacterium]